MLTKKQAINRYFPFLPHINIATAPSCIRSSATAEQPRRRAMLVNLCYVSQGMGVKKVSNSKSDLQGHGIGNGAIRWAIYDLY